MSGCKATSELVFILLYDSLSGEVIRPSGPNISTLSFGIVNNRLFLAPCTLNLVSRRSVNVGWTIDSEP